MCISQQIHWIYLCWGALISLFYLLLISSYAIYSTRALVSGPPPNLVAKQSTYVSSLLSISFRYRCSISNTGIINWRPSIRYHPAELKSQIRVYFSFGIGSVLLSELPNISFVIVIWQCGGTYLPHVKLPHFVSVIKHHCFSTEMRLWYTCQPATWLVVTYYCSITDWTCNPSKLYQVGFLKWVITLS